MRPVRVRGLCRCSRPGHLSKAVATSVSKKFLNIVSADLAEIIGPEGLSAFGWCIRKMAPGLCLAGAIITDPYLVRAEDG